MKKLWMVLLMAAFAAASGVCAMAGTSEDDNQPRIISSGDYDYSINDKTASIVRYTGDDDKIMIPSEINEYQVTAIEDEAFRYLKFKGVTVPGSIRSIGRQAFEYCEITDSLQLPKGVTISEDAFSYAVLPAVLTIPAEAVVEKCAFSYCEAVEQVCVEPDAALQGRAFSYCNDLQLAVCAEGSRLEEKAFECCRQMKKVFLCGNVKTEKESFFGCVDAEVTGAAAGEYDTLKKTALRDLAAAGPDKEEERVLDIAGSPASSDGVTVTLESAAAQRQIKPDRYEYSFAGTIENNSDEGVMQVIYTFALRDENGEEFRSFAEVYDGEDTAIPPHTSIEFHHDGIKWGAQSVPAAVEIGISSVKTETELPPVHVPKKGEYLYQALGDEKLANIKEKPPVELSFHVDQGGYGRTAVFTEGEALKKAIALLCDIQIGEESGEWVTDNYNGIGLKWDDGSYTGISLNLNNLEYWAHSSIHTYELKNLGAFWSYCEDYLEEDAPYDPGEDNYESTDPGMS